MASQGSRTLQGPGHHMLAGCQVPSPLVAHFQELGNLAGDVDETHAVVAVGQEARPLGEEDSWQPGGAEERSWERAVAPSSFHMGSLTGLSLLHSANTPKSSVSRVWAAWRNSLVI